VTASISAAGDAQTTAAVADHPRTVSRDGVHCELLRAGRVDEKLFIVPGLEGDPTELTALVSALAGPQEVYAVAPLLTDAEHRPLVGIERIAHLMVQAVRERQPSGPYRLGGFSFGGLIALEMAQQLRSDGERVESLFLIEAVYDERYWPRGIWLRALARRTYRHLRRIGRMRPTSALAELRLRGVHLIQRVMRRNVEAPDPLQAATMDAVTLGGRARAAISGYRPRYYDGRVTLVASSIDRHFGCDTAQLWTGFADRLEIERVAGDHVTIMHEPTGAAAVANIIDHQLATARTDWAGLRPTPVFERPMILTTMRWFSVARLAHALIEAGFSVSACRPKAHVLDVVDGLASDRRLTRFGRMRSLIAAIRQCEPDIILPDDERSLALMRRLHERARTDDPVMAALIARSLGNVEDWTSITSRTALMTEARTLNIPAPTTQVIETVDALNDWVAEHGLPVVLKTDGSWGGKGVAIIREPSHVHDAWRRISNPPALPRALKRVVVNRETASLTAWVRRTRPVVNAQQFVAGREAIVTVACIDGKVQSLVCLDVVQASQPKGHAATVRIIDHPGMAEAARRLVDRFGLSGFCGLDFVVTDSGEAQLLEVNARVTPTCHLLVEGERECGQTIVLFPPEAVVAGDSASTTSGVLDRPVRAPSLVQCGERIALRQDRPVARMARRLKRKLIPTLD
jgi:thioesterase domain-containing protein